jgi:hypothetical protein
MKTFMTSIIAASLVMWPFIYRMMHQTTNNEIIVMYLICWLLGFVTAIVGLSFAKETSKELYYLGKMICAIVLAGQLICAILFLSSFAKGWQ